MLRRLMCCFGKGGATNNSSITDDSKLDQKNAAAISSKIVKGSQSPVMVEIFTSQGCSSCPPADLIMSQLEQEDLGDIPIVVLAFHVEYWDYLGWKDPFASSSWTLRQRNYGQSLQQESIYTPEVVVQGRTHCIASGLEPILALIKSAPRFAAPDINASFKIVPPLSLEVNLELSLKFKVDGVDVMLAILENGLVTNCEKGENKGRILTNDFVVRSLTKVTTLQNWSPKKTIRSKVSLPLWPSFSRAKSGVALFLQNPSTMEAYGAHLLELPDDLDV